MLVDGVGYATDTYKLRSGFELDSTSVTSSTAGNSITIEGSGFLPIDDEKFEISTNNSNLEYEITEVTPTSIDLEVGECVDGETTKFTFKIDQTTKTFDYVCDAASTPVVTMTTTSPVDYDGADQDIEFDQTNVAITALPLKAYAYLVDTTGDRFGDDIELDVSDNTAPAFILDGTTLSSGKYKFRFFYEDFGYASNAVELEISEDVTPPAVAAALSGYNGGALIEITGTGLNLESTLIVGGRVEAVLNKDLSTPSKLSFIAPAYVSKLSNAEYQLAKETELEGYIISDSNTNAENAFDNKYSTAYNLNSDTNYVGLDFGPISQAVITKVRFFVDQSSPIPDFVIKGSSDKVTWTTIGAAGKTVAGWNKYIPEVVPANELSSYRYVAIKTAGAQLKVSEV